MTIVDSPFIRTALFAGIGLALTVGPVWAWGEKKPELPFRKGETITYTIKKMRVNSGQATLTFEGEVEVAGQKAYLINFKADGPGFLDEEKIYLNVDTFLPIRVERNVDIGMMRKKEKIIEHYNGQEVKIVKTAGGKNEEQVIKKKEPMENLYGFIYRYRKEGSFKLGDSLQMNLPTADVKLKLVKMEKVKAEDKDQEAFYMESNPKKYKVWFDTTDRKVPLRIDGAIGFGSTAMILKEYSSGN